MCFGGGDGGAGAMRKQQKEQQAAIETATANINKAFSGFDDKFYNARTQAYENYAMPQLGQQLQQTQNQLGYRLAGQGLTNSSAARKLGESLSQEANTQRQGIANNALAQTGQLRQNIAQQQSNLVSEANAANNPSSIAQQAIGTAGAFNAPSPLQPLGQLFGNWANMYLAKQNNNTYGSIGSPAYLSPQSLSGGYGASMMSPTSFIS